MLRTKGIEKKIIALVYSGSVLLNLDFSYIDEAILLSWRKIVERTVNYITDDDIPPFLYH